MATEAAALLREARAHSDRAHDLMAFAASPLFDIQKELLLTQHCLQRHQLLALEAEVAAAPVPDVSAEVLESELQAIAPRIAPYSLARILLAKFEIRPRKR